MSGRGEDRVVGYDENDTLAFVDFRSRLRVHHGPAAVNSCM